MVENIENTEDPITPPLPKGFKVIKKEPEAPPLPSGFTPLKKKESTESTSTTTPSSGGSAPKTGSSGGVNPFPKANIPSPIPDFDSVWKEKKSVEKPKTFRLPNEADEVEMQRRGITPPPSEMLKQTANNTKAIYDLDANGNVIPEKPNKLFAGLKKQDKTKGFYQQGEELVKQNKDIQNGFSEKTTFELDGGKLIPKTTVKDFKTSEGIDKEIENNDLNLDHPYLYYSTFNKENQPKDTFVESNFGENKLADLGINTADFDGFLNKKGYKAEFLEKEANGLFEGKGADLTGGYNIQLAKEIQKQRLLNLYMQDINSRDFAKRKLNQEKVNLGKLGADREQLNTQYTLFDSNKVGAFYEKEMPILTQKLKERDAENKKIYDTHKNGDAGFFYGTKQVLNSGWNGFLDRVNQTSSTMLDKIGLDSGADELRLLNEERQVQRPNTRDVGYASGRTATYDGVDYLVTNDGQIIDKDKKIRVTDLFFKPTYDAIVNESKSGAEDSVFSFQGSAIQAGGVLGDMIVQVALQRGVGLASGATVKAGSLLSKIPISKSIGSAIIAQSALGYSQGLEQTYKAAIDAGIDEKTAKVLATDAAQRMAGLYAVTAPISPQTKAIEGIFGSEGKELIKKAIAAYTQTGEKGFIETFKQGGKQLSKNAIIFTEEGGKEVFQENTQQTGESYGVNASINRDIGRELLKETISGDEFVNTSILSFGSGGLMTLPGMFSSTDKLKTLQQLSKDPLAFEKNLKELVSKGVFANEKADILRKDVKIYSNQAHKIPKNLNTDIAMDVMSDLEDISQLEVKKKGIDKSFHEEIDAEIEAKRTGIRDRINFVGLSKKEIAALKETASDELIAEAKEQGKKEFSFDNKQITERANVIYSKQIKESKNKENEQNSETNTNPRAETQPQTEVQEQQPEAEKVEELRDSPEISQNQEQSPRVVEQTTSDTKEPAAEVSPVPSLSEIESNEATPKSNSPTNGNVSIGATNVGESGVSEQEVTPKVGIQNPVDGGKGKGDVEVSPLSEFEKIAKESKTVDEAFDKVKNIQGVSPEISKAFREKYDPNGDLSPKVAFKAFYDEVKGDSNTDKGNNEADIKGLKFTTHTGEEVSGKRLKEALNKVADDWAKNARAIKEENLYADHVSEDTKVKNLEKGLEYAEEIRSGKTINNFTTWQRVNTELTGESVPLLPSTKTTKTQKPTTKEIVAERVKLSDSKIDAKSDVVKAKLKAFTDMFPSADINPDDYHTNGFSPEAIIDMVAKAAKSIAKGAIVTEEHIKEAIKAFNTHFDDEVDIEAVKERVGPKEEVTNNFEFKKGKKSLLGRLIEGGNPDKITNALKELGEDYDVRNQEEANKEAINFIDKVGASEALKAVRDGLVKNSDVKMLIYDEALTRLKTEISEEIERSPEDRESLIEKFQEISNEFDNAVRDAGQGIAILNYIYNKNTTLKYNLKKQIADYKRNSPEGTIPDDVKAKFEELDAKLKDVEERTKLAEERAKKAEEELAMKNIQESLNKQKSQEKSTKAKAKVLANKIRQVKIHKPGIFSSATPASLVWDGAIEIVAKSVEAGGTLADAIQKGMEHIKKSNWYKNLSTDQQNEAENTFKDSLNQSENTPTIKIGKSGKITIPAKMLRDYVEQGYTDINEISELILNDIKDEFPDVELRDIRDAITGYGKQINPNKDEISAQVNKLKEYGRLLSAYEDVLNGEMPKKSGLTRSKPEQKARELRKEINRLAKELDLESVDLEKQWATAIDKVKSHLKNQIEDLDKQIANVEKRKVERTSIKLDAEAEILKAIRDEKRKFLDELVGKPELTEEQKITKAEAALEKSIEKLDAEIKNGEIDFKEKSTPLNSLKLESLRAQKKALIESRKVLREEAGLIEAQRLKTAKTRVKNQIEDLTKKIKNKDFAKKEVKPILADNELNSLRAEKEAIHDEYDKQKYIQELANRSTKQKYLDASLEAVAVQRAIKASLDLGLIGIQLRGFTYAELWRNPMDLGRKFSKLFGAIGSQKKTDKAMSLLIGHPLYNLAKKLDIGITHPDLRNEVREEMASGNLLHVAWNIPMIATNMLGKTHLTEAKRKSIGDTFIDGAKKQFNKISKNNQLAITEKEKFSREEQWKNMNVFEAVERGLSTYGNQLRFEEFVRGVERLKADGKDEINHKEHYEALASAIRTFSGRANPNGLKMNQKFLNVFFFSFKNGVSVFQQLNPYYVFYELNKPNFKNGIYKPTVAGKMAMATMFKSVTSTAATMLFLMAGYNAFKDDDDEEMTIETDPRSSDFGKVKVGDLRYDPWGGYIPLITLYARLATDETKKSDGTVEKLGSSHYGLEDRGDAMGNFMKNKFSPSFQAFYHAINSKDKLNKETGEIERVNSFGKKLSEDEAYSLWPIFLGSVKQAIEEDADGYQSFLTAYSILGLGNVQKYESSKKKTKSKKFNPDEGFKEFEPKEFTPKED